ncbi:Sir2 family NAD+-dependent deacetylase [Bowmanella dokdonensis]|uniref:NAD-dependent protein deacylase n=1 Tax=Bowmanella dokdonensis TaxID=751969 RepID=A0A939DKH6_9ALTE|nr:NAD-dependent protein deacylase [Bowmanella dokdonensis]
MKYKKVVILTGAGISAESGLSTFRDSNGLWENHRVEEVATPEAFARDPDLVYRFYNLRRQQLAKVLPNAAHHALARLEREFPGNFLLVSQNVDDLHQRAGSRKLIAMHGELSKARCIQTEEVFDFQGDFSQRAGCQCCRPASKIRPHVVWFGEMPLQMEHIGRALRDADLFVAIGTSGQVYPAAGFVAEANRAGAHSIEINLQSGSGTFAQKRCGLASHLVPRLVDELLKT